MKPSEIQSYFWEKLEALGLRENPNAFGRNVPAGLADQTYVFEMAQTTIQTTNQVTSKFTMPVTVSVYFKDYRTDADLRSVALLKMEEIFGLILTGPRSLGPTGFSIQPTGVSIDPLAQGNLACAIMRVNFDVAMYLTFRGH